MKIIDLLNRIANGEEVPKKIFYSDKIWYWDIKAQDYVEDDKRLFNYYIVDELMDDLNDEIEIVEDTPKISKLYINNKLQYDLAPKEDKKDKEIEIYINGEKVDITDIFEPLKQGEYFYKENDKWYVHKLKNVSFVMEKDKKIENIKVKSNFTHNQKKIVRKINEIIDYINKGDK